MKTLIVFYSRTNNTKKIAEEVGKKLDAQLIEIKSSEMKKGFIGFLKAGKQAAKKSLPAIKVSNVDMDEFDLIVLGTPVWVGTMASPMRTFLVENQRKFNKVAFFCTCGDKQSKTFDEFKKLVGVEPLATLELNKKDLNKGYQNKIQNFISELKNN